MAARLGGSQISSLLETVPGIASVLRSPVADAIVNMVRAGAGIGTFDNGMAKELIQYAIRRGLLPIAEGDELLAEVEATMAKKRRRASKVVKQPKKKAAAKPKAVKKAAVAKKPTKKATPPAAKKTTKTGARPSPKTATRKPKSSKPTKAKRR